MRPAGNSVNAIVMTTTMPIVIIHPKSMTGRMPLTIREENATIVVITVKAHGTNLSRTVCVTSQR